MQCEVCGNEYDQALTITRGDARHVFDCFECAVEKMAPRCKHCACRVIGHGLQSGSDIYCCAHCAEQDGISGFVDRV